MSESLTAMGAGTGIPTVSSNSHVCDIASAFPNRRWTGNGEQIGASAFFSISVSNVNSRTPLPCDVLDLLVSAVLLAEAVVQLDRAGCDGNAQRAVYSALAEIKHRLHEVTRSRALE
jgi:hypothetical protein